MHGMVRVILVLYCEWVVLRFKPSLADDLDTTVAKLFRVERFFASLVIFGCSNAVTMGNGHFSVSCLSIFRNTTWISYLIAVHESRPIYIGAYRCPPRYRYTSSSSLLPKQPPHPLQHAVLLGVVWVVFRGYLEQGGERCRVALNAMPYPFGDL